MIEAAVVRDTEWDDPIREDELPDAADTADADHPALVPCPSCGAMIHDEAQCCPHCGDWVIAVSPAEQRAGGWLWPLVVAALVAVILVFWHGLGR